MRKLFVLFLVLGCALGVGGTAFANPPAKQENEDRRKLTIPQKGRRGKGEGARRRHRGIGHAFKHAGKSAGRGGKRFGKNMARGRPVRAGKELGKGMGGFGKGVGKGTARTGKKVGKSVKRALTP